MNIWLLQQTVFHFPFHGFEKSSRPPQCTHNPFAPLWHGLHSWYNSTRKRKCPHSRLHRLSGVVLLFKGQQHSWTLWCAVLLCIRKGWRRVQKGHGGPEPQQECMVAFDFCQKLLNANHFGPSKLKHVNQRVSGLLMGNLVWVPDRICHNTYKTVSLFQFAQASNVLQLLWDSGLCMAELWDSNR